MARSILCMGLDEKEQRVNPRVSTEEGPPGKQARKSSEDAQAAGYARFEKVRAR